ncbi:leucine-rich repeat flightless-interacting protein 2-like [Ictalurus furcatus]|uniref:leucine-rich repeat flightless-interacting protein 2-like n=1 Tax=Ictalurus furcatus TaxID=66913 RepID=UPI002350B535|nr:leucine-rich repeat flightless-interacting protein 2-like [Ictalurus furcatus]
MNLARSRTADLPLRPLLYAAGAAAAAAGVYYYIKKRGDGERTVEPADTTLTEDPVQTQLPLVDSLLDPGLMSDRDGVSVTQTDRAVPQSDMMAQMNTLRGSVQQLEEELSETHRLFDKITREREREQEEHSLLKSKYNEMRETLQQRNELLKEYEQEQEAHSILNSLCDCMSNNEKSLKVSLAEAEKKYEQAMESNDQLENEKSDLLSQMNILQSSVKQLEEELTETQKMHVEITNDYEILQCVYKYMISRYNSMEYRLNEKIDSLRATVALAEMKYQEVVESNDNLNNRNSELITQVNEMQRVMNELEQQHASAQRTFHEITRENERKDQELRKLYSTQKDMQDIVFKDYEALCQTHTTMISQNNELKEQHEELLKECERQREAHDILRSQYEKMKDNLSDNEKSLMATLAEAVATHEQALESNAQLEKEKVDLMYHVHKLRGTVQQLEEMLYEANITCNMIMQDLERAGDAYSILKSQYEDILKQRD